MPEARTIRDNHRKAVQGRLLASPLETPVSFCRVGEESERVALVESATAWQAFRYVTSPPAGRGVLWGMVMR